SLLERRKKSAAGLRGDLSSLSLHTLSRSPQRSLGLSPILSRGRRQCPSAIRHLLEGNESLMRVGSGCDYSTQAGGSNPEKSASFFANYETGPSTLNRGHEHQRSIRRCSAREGRPRRFGGAQRGSGT